jgi:hypothetical protein
MVRITVTEVSMATAMIVKNEYKKIEVPTTLNPQSSTHPSMKKISRPTLSPLFLEMICANISVPPVEVPYRSIKPIPSPINPPPIIALT